MLGAQILLNHSALEFDRGQYRTAEQEAGQSLDALRKLGGENTPYVASALTQAGRRPRASRDPNSAVPMLREALEIRRGEHSCGASGRDAGRSAAGRSSHRRRKLAEAEQTLRAAMQEERSASFRLCGLAHRGESERTRHVSRGTRRYQRRQGDAGSEPERTADRSALHFPNAFRRVVAAGHKTVSDRLSYFPTMCPGALLFSSQTYSIRSSCGRR